MIRAPVFIGDIELTKPISPLALPVRNDARSYNAIRLLVRMQRIPVGYVLLTPESLDESSIAKVIWSQLGEALNAIRVSSGLPPLRALPTDGLPREDSLEAQLSRRPFVSVVVCTRDRPEGALVTLRGLMSLQYKPFEVVLVDNAPSSAATREAVLAEFGSDRRVRYVCEPQPGLSRARNRGVNESAAEIIAFTDDDVHVDPWWLDGLVRGFFEADEVACVTGLTRAAALENSAQLYFEQRCGWGTICKTRLFDMMENRDGSTLYPYSPSVFGTGANFAMTRSSLAELGGFDEALGAGSLCGGGEDIDMFMRTILSGRRLVYEPSAIVSHTHRADMNELARQMKAYGSGCTAALTAIAMRDPRARRELPFKVLGGIRKIIAIRSRTKGNPAFPSGLRQREILGMLLGPWLYLKARRETREL
jgi:GT2 family glycosyltransferase